jgi:hypothetical protein
MRITNMHLKLLSNAYVGWQDCESGAPEINPKRPYGNSFVAGDVARILQIPIHDEGDGMTERQQEEMLTYHLQTKEALQFVLRSLSNSEVAKLILGLQK